MPRRLRPWALAAAALVSVPAAAAEDFLAATPLHEAGLARYWQLRLPLAQGQQVRDAHLVDDALYLGTADGFVYALDAYTGVLRWVQPVSRSGYRVRRPCHVGNRVVFVTPVDIQVYDRRTGDALQRLTLRFPPGTAAVTDGVRLFIGGIDRRLHTLDAETLYRSWRITTDGPILAAPALYGEHVFVASDAGTVYACTRDDKSFHWQAETNGTVSADLVAAEQGVFVASRDLSLYLFDLGFGQLRWRARFSSPLLEPPVVTPELAYQFSEADGLAAVEMAQVGVEERIRWKLPAGRTALTADGGVVYVLGRDQTLLAVRTADGQVTHTIPAPGFSLGLPDVATTTVFLVAPDGRIFCARPRSAPPLRKEDVLAALRPPPPADEAAATPGRPAAAPEVPDLLESSRRGLPIGGKSKISRGYGEGGGSK